MRWHPAVVVIICAAFSVDAAGQRGPLEQVAVPVAVNSGEVSNPWLSRRPVFDRVVRVPDAQWIRLTFDDVVLGSLPEAGEATILRMTSLADGAVQTLDAIELGQWRNTSAYFNGDAVKVELIADPAAAPSRLVISTVMAGLPDNGAVASICGETDDRVPSADPATGRALPTGCTAWLISDEGGCMLSAGHCLLSTFDVVQFNVPLSDGAGTIVHPGPEDQYTVQNQSIQFAWGEIGNDWCYFGCFPNSETGLTPLGAQGAMYELSTASAAEPDDTIRVTGYGLDDTPPEQNKTQQTHAGPFVGIGGTIIQYQVDTRPGNSGSAVILEQTGEAIGIHTDSGCDAAGGANNGTAIDNPGLQAALGQPAGVCLPAPLLDFSFPVGIPDVLDPAGQTIRFEVTGLGGGTPQPGTGAMLYDAGAGYVQAAVNEVSTNVYDALVPALPCGAPIQFYFSAQTTTAQVVTNPTFAPLVHYDALTALSVETSFSDTFELDLGWTVVDSPDLTHGTWERGVPITNGIHGSPLADADGSGQCFLTENHQGNGDVDGGSTVLTSPTLDASGDIEVISYWRWYSNGLGGAPFQDVFVVEVSDDDGQSWVVLETVGPGGAEVNGGWIFRQFAVDQFIARTDQFRIRFTASDMGAKSNIEAAVDGLDLTTVTCALPVGDIDGDGVVGIADLLLLLGAWGPCGGPCPPTCSADLDGDCVVGINDFLTLLANWT